MTRNAALMRTAAALRELDPAPSTPPNEDERRRAEATLARILATSPGPEDVGEATDRPRRRSRRLLLAVGVLAVGVAVALPTVLGGGAAFADWSATPVPLSPRSAAAAAATCRSHYGMRDQSPRVVLGERRGGWTFVLLDGSREEALCLMPDDLVGASDIIRARRERGFFGSYDTDPPRAPKPARDDIVETGSAGGTVSVPGRLPGVTVDGWFAYVTGFAGRDVVKVTVDPPVGPDVEASLEGGRFAAWWPSGEARGENPGVGGAWSYTVTLADGTTRRV